MKKLVLCGVVSVLSLSNVVYAGAEEKDSDVAYCHGGLISEEEVDTVRNSQEKRMLEDLFALPSNSSCIDVEVNSDFLTNKSNTNKTSNCL